MRLSICIPTYNRSRHLANCLQSIVKCTLISNYNFEVCISDNNSKDNTKNVVRSFKSKLKIKYSQNSSNLGQSRNFLNVVSMADGDFIWLIGDDDLLMPNAIDKICKLIDSHSDVDFFYVNSFQLDIKYLDKFAAPFDTINLPKDMERFSKKTNSGELEFFDLIDPKVSFDFLGGMFLAVFRKENWTMNAHVLNKNAITDSKTFSHFDNTFPHMKIWANAFSNSKAYFNDEPLNVCLSGVREWSNMYPLVHSIRIVEGLREYRNNGLEYWKYIYCKNFALNNFIPEFIYLVLNKKDSGYSYINPTKVILGSLFFPNFYLSLFYFIGRKLRKIINKYL